MTSWFATAIARHGDRAALVGPAGTITYAELADRVESVAQRLGTDRRLVLLAGANHPDAVVVYLAALAGHHPLILVGADNGEAVRGIMDAYDPDVVVRPDDGEGRWVIDERRERTTHQLHPDLALLLGTSGSTGEPKLVRLSRTNLQANAESIATYLEISEADRAITSLPIAYCYGLSVINSHLLRGASVVLTDRSVVDPEFWDLLSRFGATSFAGVPYTFDLLDRIGFADKTLPSLRYLTQAGGRLDPRRVREYAELGARRGWKLCVMYGQTEATARMTYLPPELTATRPESIGIPIPGGSLRLDPLPDRAPDAGELVYRGPNVMLGYAEGPSDLARGRTVHELRTGDIGRRDPDGMYEIVGRRSEFLKIAGLRIDPRDIERLAERRGALVGAVGTDEQLVVFAEADAPADLDAIVRGAIRIPAGAIRVVPIAELPRLPNGKLDRPALRRLAASTVRPDSPERTRHSTSAVRNLYASVLGRPNVVDRDSFSSLGGDSLSYVEITLGLEEILGRLPDGWPTKSVGELGAMASTPADLERRRWSLPATWRSVEMSVALRAIAIVLIVASHIGMISAFGGAHVLMTVAGFNFARFRLTTTTRGERVRSQLRATARIAIPAIAWVAVVMVLLDEYELRHLFLVNALVHDELWGNLWFIELLVYIGLAMALLLAVPALDRAERRRPFVVALAIVGVGLLFRFEVLDFGVPYTMPVLWLFGIGWAASRAERPWQRWLVLAIALAAIPGYFDSWERNGLILLGVALLVGIPRVVVPRGLARVGGILAGASLYIYLVHWEVWPMFEGWYGLPSLLVSLGAGIALWQMVTRASALVAGMGRGIWPWGRIGAVVSRRASAS